MRTRQPRRANTAAEISGRAITVVASEEKPVEGFPCRTSWFSQRRVAVSMNCAHCSRAPNATPTWPILSVDCHYTRRADTGTCIALRCDAQCVSTPLLTDVFLQSLLVALAGVDARDAEQQSALMCAAHSRNREGGLECVKVRACIAMHCHRLFHSWWRRCCCW